MQTDFPHIMARLVGEPLLAHPEKARVVAAAVMRRQGIEINVAASAEFVNAPKAGPLQERRMVQTAEDGAFLVDPASGIAVVEITGSLAHRQGRIGKSSGVRGYDGIRAQLEAALEAPSVRGIILDLHSPGGEVHGAFQLADRIFAARGRKPIVAVVDEMAYSAGYLIASAADDVWLASSMAGVGSIGAVLVHVSYERMIEAEGIDVSLFSFGARKTEGNPFKDLTREAAGNLQARIDHIGREFVSRVARFRRMPEKAVTATEAGTFVGQEAVRLRLADGIADPLAVFAALSRRIQGF